MEMYQKFQEAIKNGNFKEALLIVFSNNLQFQITTSVVSSVENKLYSYRSNLNLLKGIETEISSKLLNDQYQNINEFHQKQVNQADQIWQNNTETLIEIFQILSRMAKHQDFARVNDSNLSSETTSTMQESNSNEDLRAQIDDFSVDNVMENEAEVLNLETENTDNTNVVKEDWSDIFNDANDSETTDEKPSKSFSSVPVEDEDDWEKWMDDEQQGNSSQANLEEFEWEDEENWDDFNPNLPVENMTENK